MWCQSTTRPFGVCKALVILMGAGLVSDLRAAGADGGEGEGVPPVTRVEEDWVLVLNEPDDSVDSPQFHTVMSPLDHLDSVYAQVLWNYREIPDFASGGVQLHSYDGDFNLQKRSVENRQLSNSAETITWTQALSTDGVMLSFEVANGLSETWGTFGRDMRIDESADLSDLSGYDPQTSVDNACVTYGSNRVDLLLLAQVRYYAADGTLLWTDAAPRIVYEFGDDE